MKHIKHPSVSVNMMNFHLKAITSLAQHRTGNYLKKLPNEKNILLFAGAHINPATGLLLNISPALIVNSSISLI